MLFGHNVCHLRNVLVWGRDTQPDLTLVKTATLKTAGSANQFYKLCSHTLQRKWILTLFRLSLLQHKFNCDQVNILDWEKNLHGISNWYKLSLY